MDNLGTRQGLILGLSSGKRIRRKELSLSRDFKRLEDIHQVGEEGEDVTWMLERKGKTLDVKDSVS